MQANQYVWRTAAIIRETNDAVTVIFETGASTFEYQPGQYINIRVNVEGVEYLRSYSLSSCPDGDEKPAITVKRVQDGTVSNFIFNHAEDIHEWIISGPHGQFYIQVNLLSSRQFVFIAGGSGITPLYSMLKYLIKNTDASVLLIYCNKTEEDIIFSKALNYLFDIYSNRLEIYHVLSKGKEEVLSLRKSIKGRLSRLVLKKLLKGISSNVSGSHSFFLCGPAGLITLAEEVIEELNLKETAMYKEYFHPENSKELTIVLPGEPREVLLNYYDRTNLLQVIPGQTILESGLKDKVPIQYSCKGGTCGVCNGRLTSGEVHMAKNFALTPDELQQGYILLCQSYPLSNDVTVVVE